MASDSNKGWRNQSSNSSASKSAQRGWQQGGPTVRRPRQPLSRRTKLTLALIGCFLVLCGIIAWPLLFHGIPPVPVVVIGASYEETRLAVPPNLFGPSVQRDLEKWAAIDPFGQKAVA